MGVAWESVGKPLIPDWIWDGFGVVWGEVFGSQAVLFGYMFKGIRKTFGFQKVARRADERLVLRFDGAYWELWWT